jgi:hypothetical protein
MMHRSKTTSAFSMARAGVPRNADTDLSKMPPGFSESEPQRCTLAAQRWLHCLNPCAPAARTVVGGGALLHAASP